MATKPRLLSIAVQEGLTVSAAMLTPSAATACYVFAHGAGSGMNHAFMAAAAAGLAERGIATVRFQFPFMERGGRRPDPPALAHAAVQAAVRQARKHFAGLPLFGGGKSFGARMSSQAQALGMVPELVGLVFLGFPLHPAGKVSVERATHLHDVTVPMLFIQGTEDRLAERAAIRRVASGLGALATLVPVAAADHSFHVPKRSGQDDASVLESLLDDIAVWMSAWRIAAG